ncbi:MAG TPA: hypothetical protein DDY31_19420 [Lachnospiraceae bacterium]|nr:hypothetical protein [Lachnospiraceae bacterium]
MFCLIFIFLSSTENIYYCGTKSVKAASDNDLPVVYPVNGQKYWVIFREGFRDSRIEMTTCNVAGNNDNLWIEWNGGLYLKGGEAEDGYNQYYLNENTWEQIGTYHIFTDWATSVIASNLDIYNTDGELVLEKTNLYEIENPDDPSVPEEQFNEYIYRANLLLSGDYPGSKEEYISLDTPSKVMVQELQKNGFGDTARAWKSFTDTCDTVLDAGKTIDIVIEEKDMYSAIILNAMESAVEYSLIDTINADVIKDSEELLSLIKEVMKLNYDLKIDKETRNSTLTDEMRKRVKQLMDESFEKKGFSKAVSWLSNFEEVMDFAGTLEDYCQEVASYVNLRKINASMKEVLKEMGKLCPKENKALQSALDDCINILNISDNEFEEQMCCGVLKCVGREAAKAVVSHFWDKIVIKKIEEIRPELAIVKLFYKGSKYVTNLVLNTDELTEKYFKMVAVLEVDSLVKSTYYSLKSKYQREKTIDNAEAYLSAIDVFFNLLEYDCESSYAYVDELSSANLTKICALFGQNDGNSLKEAINNIKSHYYQEYEAIYVSWVNYLEGDYPEIYPYYSHLIEESMERRIEYKIHCPVDVYVYDSQNTPVVSVVNGLPATSELTVLVEDDEKIIYVPEGEEYTFKYIGNDIGSMDINITEYDKDSAVLRDVYFNDLALAKGTTYVSAENGRLLEDKEYQISVGEEESLEPDFDTFFSDKRQSYNVKISEGTIYKKGEPYYNISAYAGEVLDISAFIPEGYKFEQWEVTFGEAKIGDMNREKTTLKIVDGDVEIKAILRNVAVEEPTVIPSPTTEPEITEKPIVSVSPTTEPVTTEKPTVSPIPTTKPEITEKPTVSPDSTTKPETTEKPSVSQNPIMKPDVMEDNKTNSSQKLRKGSEITDKKTKAVYRITGTGKRRAVEYIKSTKKKLTSVVIPDVVKLKGKSYKVTSIGKRAFKNSKQLKTVKIGKNVKTIKRQAFSVCAKLKNITLGKNVKSIGEEAFNKCTALTIITIPSKVAKIEEKAFYRCKNLRYILVKTNKLIAKNVGYNAFGKGALKLRVKTDKSKWKLYSKIFIEKGMSNKAIFIIDPVKLVI